MTDRSEGSAAWSGRRTVLWLVAICTLIEVTLSLADIGALGPARLRSLAYDFGGFWPGLLRDWSPNFRAQPILMFLTYGFLHGGIVHLAVNMITLWSLSRTITDRVGNRNFLVLYVAALLGGALGYATLVPDLTPMVGASGALFGLAGGILAWAYVDLYAMEDRLWPVARAVLLLGALNLVLWWAMDGHLAWQTHLGGFLTGWIVALLIDPRARTEDL